MCGRYSQTYSYDDLREHFTITNMEDISARYNIAPGQDAPVVLLENRKRTLRFLKWGLVPYWSKDAKSGHRMINLRKESLLEKPGFRQAITQRRCLIPTDGFFEWAAVLSIQGKVPFRFVLKHGGLFAFAGIWENWVSSKGDSLNSYTIFTGPPNSLLKQYHHRMPMILKPNQYAQWLNPAYDVQSAVALLDSYPSEEMKAFSVSTLVNSPKNDMPDILASADLSSYKEPDLFPEL